MKKMIIILSITFIVSSVILDELISFTPEIEKPDNTTTYLELFSKKEQEAFVVEYKSEVYKLNMQEILVVSPEEESTDMTNIEETPSYIVSCSEADYQNLLQIVEAEATDADILAKILVANVIINRVNHSYFPNTLTEVIFQGNGEQFSPIYDGRFYTVTVTESTIEAVNRALAGEDYSQGALFFAADYCLTPNSWHTTNLKRLFEYGGHVYFTFPEGSVYG